MTHDEMIAVIAAHRDGKVLEVCEIGTCRWELSWSPIFNFDNFIYRIKPEPIVIWVNVYGREAMYAYSSEDAAKDRGSSLCTSVARKFIQVIE